MFDICHKSTYDIYFFGFFFTNFHIFNKKLLTFHLNFLSQSFLFHCLMS